MASHLNWTNKIHGLSYRDFRTQIYEFNKSIAFITDHNDANMLLNVQKQLDTRGYHITQVCIRSSYASYIVFDFPFVERLNEIYHRFTSSGLFGKWFLDNWKMKEQSVKAFHQHYFQIKKEVLVNQFEVSMFIVYGWIASTILFVIEIIWGELKLKYRKR